MYRLRNPMEEAEWDDGPNVSQLADRWIAMYPEGDGERGTKRDWDIRDEEGTIVASFYAIHNNAALFIGPDGSRYLCEDFEYLTVEGQAATRLTMNGEERIIRHS